MVDKLTFIYAFYFIFSANNIMKGGVILKKFIRDNKAICFMLLIIIACLGISVALLLKYFYFGNGELLKTRGLNF